MNKVSIILPIYNAEKTIEVTIDSLVKQTYKNIEIIAISDGSTDSSKEICEILAKKNRNIKFIHRENRGVSYTRNEAIKMATGDYIMFVDSDDKYELEMVEIMLNSIKEYDLVICGYKRINTLKNKEVIRALNSNKMWENDFECLIKELQAKNLFNQIWNKIFRSKIIKDNKIYFDETISLGEDFKFVLNYMQYCNNVKYIDKCLYLYTNGLEGLNQKFRKDKLDIRINNSLYFMEYFAKNKYDFQYVYHDFIVSCVSGLKNMYLIKNIEERKVEIEKFINNKTIKEKLKQIREKSNSVKDKIYCNILLIESVHIISVLIFFLNIIDYLNKKKLGY